MPWELLVHLHVLSREVILYIFTGKHVAELLSFAEISLFFFTNY